MPNQPKKTGRGGEALTPDSMRLTMQPSTMCGATAMAGLRDDEGPVGAYEPFSPEHLIALCASARGVSYDQCRRQLARAFFDEFRQTSNVDGLTQLPVSEKSHA